MSIITCSVNIKHFHSSVCFAPVIYISEHKYAKVIWAQQKAEFEIGLALPFKTLIRAGSHTG